MGVLIFSTAAVVFCLTWLSNIMLNLLGTAKIYSKKIKSYDKPIDANLYINGHRLIGDSSTVGGLFICIFLTLCIYFMSADYAYAIIPLLVYSGDTLGSFIKRRFDMREGSFLPIVDHGDYMIFTGIVMVLFERIHVFEFLLLLLITYALHPLATFAAYRLKLRTKPF